MWGKGKKYCILLFGFFLAGLNLPGQDLSQGDSRNPPENDPFSHPEKLIRMRLSQDIDYFLSLSAFQFLNWSHEKNTDQLVFQQSLKYSFLLSKDSSVTFSNILIHDLGFRFFFDSLTQVQPDETTLSTRLSINLHKKLSILFLSDITSRLLNNFEYIPGDHGNPVKVQSTSFLTPLTLSFSLGSAYSWPGFGVLSLGFSSAKFTYLRDCSVFDKLNVQSLYGIPKGKNHRFEYGVSLRLLVDMDKELFSRVHWSCDLLLFKNLNSFPDITLKNLFTVKLTRFIKTSIQTRILYEEEVSKNIQVENYLNIGFSFHL